MKVKLLKKVRKRYTIIKISSYSNTSSSTLIKFCDEIGMPFFYFKDLDSPYGYRNSAHIKYSDALLRLTNVIHSDYYKNRKRKTKAREEKVWYR